MNIEVLSISFGAKKWRRRRANRVTDYGVRVSPFCRCLSRIFLMPGIGMAGATVRPELSCGGLGLVESSISRQAPRYARDWASASPKVRLAAMRSSHGAPLHHQGFEFGFVLEGQLEVTVGDRVHVARTGDAIRLDSSLPHRFRNPGPHTTRTLWVNISHPAAATKQD